MAKVIATISLKGGVGKTTVTAGLAEYMSAEFGQRVLLIDLDSQINLTTMMISEERWLELNTNGRTLATLFSDAVRGTRYFRLDEAIERGVSPVKKVNSVDLLASSLDLIEVQEDLSALRVEGRVPDGGTGFLREAIEPVLDFYDYVLIDCPPNIGPITLNGLAAADAYIIPTIPDVLSTYGIPQIQTRVRKIGHEIGRTIVELGVVITKYKANSAVHRSTAMRLRRDPTIQHVLPSYINEANSVAAAAEFTSYGTLRVKYGNQGQFDQFRGLTMDVMTEAQEKIR
ncbi:ParA family protein [Gordonia rubripertincta]|uniref:ParA family protein n=2 Tax=Gordonia rubripertincta TaxID=36822 RepID=A0AAW6RB55_GORRU|nr:ParA family protein [Gordonia rubripertincta]MDG6781863.1 ParA family protein [Gordonia rubripertincta]NKY64895.1 ParA family protein [Gordonia rubripertincta]QMU20921.1 ParA family protein [Gordonia rubripertincta]GAB85266.1 putative Soj/ParA-related protein [Gordonia rubripertincta NBRC 101908]